MPRSRGFTLVEMLVVIGLLVTLMGLTLGAIASNRNRDKLLVAEHLVGDLIRQARHSARTSGAPTTIILSRDKRSITGAVHVPAWGRDFEDQTFPGVTGNALVFDGAASPISEDLPSKDRLDRAGNRGFYIACSVRMPAAQAGAVVPLVAIGASDALSDTIAGLRLEGHQVRLQDYTALPAPYSPSLGDAPEARTQQFEIVGWIRDSSGTMIELLSLEQTPSQYPEGFINTTEPSHVTVPEAPPDGFDHANALVGEQWAHLGLLYDGEMLTLLRDGRRIRHLAVPGGLQIASNLGSTTSQVLVGALNGTAATGTGLVIDNVRIERIAASRPAVFPPLVQPIQDYRITAWPEGRVEVEGNAGGDIVISDGVRHTRITITRTGSLSSSIQNGALP